MCRLIFWILSAIFLFTGCASEDSGKVETSGIYTTYTVNGSGSVTAIFNVGGPLGTYLELSDGDSIAVNGTTLSKLQIGNFIEYTGTISVSAGDTVSFVFNREGEGSYASAVTMPNDISISSPADGSSHTAGSALTVTWSSGLSTDEVQLTLTKDNDDETGASATAADSVGSASFSASDTAKVTSGNLSSTITASRIRTGTISSAHDGEISAVQNDDIDITLTD